MNAAELPSTSKTHPRLALVGWLILSFAASISAVFVSTNGWYAGLTKPPWNPPAWAFGPAWTLLYALMAVAAWLVWREGGWKVQRLALGLFLLQWLLNALWTPLIFGMHRSGAGRRGNYITLVGAGGDTSVVLAGAQGRRCFAGALSGLGDLCRRAELRHLAA